MYLSPHPDHWGRIASRRHSHGGRNKSGQIFKLLLQSSGFSFISISDATSLPRWPSFLKGRENSFKRAFCLFLPKCKLEMYGERSQLSSEKNWSGFSSCPGHGRPPQLSSQEVLLISPFLLSLLLCRQLCWSFPHQASCIHLTTGCRHPVTSSSAVSLQLGSSAPEAEKALDMEARRADLTPREPGIGVFASKFSSHANS